MQLIKVLLSAATLVLLSACGTTQVGLSYQAARAGPAIESPAPVAVGVFKDQRGEPETWIGAIRGGFGNPLKTIETSQPVSQLVQAAMAEGLKSRGVSTGGGGLRQVSGTVTKLFCNQLAVREATVEIVLNVTDPTGSRTVFSRTFSATNTENAGLSSGVFASPEDLRALTERTLRQVIDSALDDAEFRAALRR